MTFSGCGIVHCLLGVRIQRIQGYCTKQYPRSVSFVTVSLWPLGKALSSFYLTESMVDLISRRKLFVCLEIRTRHRKVIKLKSPLDPAVNNFIYWLTLSSSCSVVFPIVFWLGNDSLDDVSSDIWEILDDRTVRKLSKLRLKHPRHDPCHLWITEILKTKWNKANYSQDSDIRIGVDTGSKLGVVLIPSFQPIETLMFLLGL